jgi:restriction endonuclease Mrr
MRDLIGTLQEHRTRANRGVLVTSGAFTEGALRLTERHQITPIDGSFLLRLLRQHNVGLE